MKFTKKLNITYIKILTIFEFATLIQLNFEYLDTLRVKFINYIILVIEKFTYKNKEWQFQIIPFNSKTLPNIHIS